MTLDSKQAMSGSIERDRDLTLSENPMRSDHEMRHHSFIETNVDGTWRLDLEAPIPLDLPPIEQVELLYRHGYFGEANQALADQYGFDTPAEIVGFRLEQFMPRELPDSIPRLTEAARSNYCLTGWQSIEQDRFRNRKVFLNNVTGEIADGKLLRVWGTAKDITRQKQLEEESRLRSAVFEQIPDGCIIVEVPSGKVVYMNAAFTDVTGYTVADILGEKLSFLQGADTDRDTVANLRQAIASEQAFAGEIVSYKKDGTPFWNLMRIAPISDSSGSVTHYVGICLDVTERKRLDEQLNEQRAHLAHLSRVAAMGELTAALAHELNQPLAAILSNAQAAQRFLEQEAPAIDDVREILRDIVADDKRAGEVMRRMRRLVKRGENQFEPLDINGVIGEVHRLVSHDMAMKQVTLDAELTPGLPALHGDPVQLQQVILNLLINACQAVMNREQGRRNILLTTANGADQSIEIRVTDSGPGIDEKIRDKIFQPFFTTKEEGMGMGLAVSRTIIEAHGGRFWAESSPGQGAVFRITLPLER